MTDRPIDVLTESVEAEIGSEADARLIAARQLHDLRGAGYTITPTFELTNLWGFLGTVVKHLPLIVPRQRAHQWRKTVRGWLDIENDGAGD